MTRLALITALLAMWFATGARADPCKAIPDRGPAPGWLKPGAVFSGPIAYVGDGDGLCVRDPRYGLVEVRLSDFSAPELSDPSGKLAKAALARHMGQRAVCTVQGGHGNRARSYDRALAVCRIGGVSIGELMRRAGVKEGGR